MIPTARIIFAITEDDVLAGERKRARLDLANWEKTKAILGLVCKTAFINKKSQFERWHNKQKFGFVGYS
jgi:hypothetical protein